MQDLATAGIATAEEYDRNAAGRLRDKVVAKRLISCSATKQLDRIKRITWRMNVLLASYAALHYGGSKGSATGSWSMLRGINGEATAGEAVVPSGLKCRPPSLGTALSGSR